MQRSTPQNAFTLIEMLTVMAIIAILASIVLSLNGVAQTKAARSKAETEIKSLTMGCENYKIDNGTYPRTTFTDAIDPRVDGNAVSGAGATKYQRASKELYMALNGDLEPADAPDFKPDSKVYLNEFFKPSVLSCSKANDGRIISVNYIQDPFGASYGYSTAGLALEEAFQNQARVNKSATRSAEPAGYNPTFDLWSTGGSTKTTSTVQDQAKWIKNW